MSSAKPIVLQIGDPIKWNHEVYNTLSSSYTVVRPSTAERQRPEFLKALKEKRWGDFQAVFRPFWNTGGEMGTLDHELVSLLPASCKVWASAGAGYDWAKVDVLAAHGTFYHAGYPISSTVSNMSNRHHLLQWVRTAPFLSLTWLTSSSAAASTDSVSDFALFLILSTFRNLNWATTSARSSPTDFTDCHTNAPAISRNPKGHSLGIIGLGNIGFVIARKAYQAFGVKIKYFDVVRKPAAREAEIGAEFFSNLDEMLGVCDCVVLATPASPDGRKAIDAQRLRSFKMGSRFVNISRGSLVDEEALADAVESGRLVGVGLDVHENEPRVNERLKALRSVTLTSHNAGGTLDT